MSSGKAGPSWLLLAAIALAPHGASAQLGSRSWSISIGAEQTRLGSYVDQQHEEKVQFGAGTITDSDHTLLRINPQTGIGVGVTMLSTRSPWGAMADASYSRGDFMINDSTTVHNSLFPSRGAVAASSTEIGPQPASSWRVGVGVVRQIRTGRNSAPAFITAGPLLTVLRLEQIATRGALLPPNYGVSYYTRGPESTRTYVSPGGRAGAGVDVGLGGHVALQLRASAGILRADGAALARDLAVYRNVGPTPHGEAQWRPFSTFGAGVSYWLGGR